MEHRETGDKFTFIESTTGEIVTVRANVLMRIGMFIDICDGERYFVTLNYQTAEKAKKHWKNSESSIVTGKTNLERKSRSILGFYWWIRGRKQI